MRTLRTGGQEVIGIDVLSSPNTDRVGSIVDRAFIAQAMRGVDAVLHAATLHVVPLPKNIYGLSKLAAEHLCELMHRLHRLPCLVLRTSRFFPEDDDVP